MTLRWRCLIESESGAMGPASIVNDLQPEQTEKSGLHNLTLKAYSPGYARHTPKQLINLPLIPPPPLTLARTNRRLRRRRERMGVGGRVWGASGFLHRSYVDCTTDAGSAWRSRFDWSYPAGVCLSVFRSTLRATGKQPQRDARSHTGLNWIVFFPAVLPLMA